MRVPEFQSRRQTLALAARIALASLAGLVALALTACGQTHHQTNQPFIGDFARTDTGTGAIAATPNVLALKPPASLSGTARVVFGEGEVVAENSGCLGCHLIGGDGDNGPGPNLTHIGARLSRVQIADVLVNPTAPMPSFAGLPAYQRRELTSFLADLR